MTIGGLKSKVSSKYNLKDSGDVIIHFNSVRYDSKLEDQIVRRKHKHVQRVVISTENNQFVAYRGNSNKVSRTPSPKARKFRQAGTRTGTKGSVVLQSVGGATSQNKYAQHNPHVR